MKKRFLVIAAGMALTVGAISGCSEKAAETTAAETTMEETKAEETTQEALEEEETEAEASESVFLSGEITAVENGTIVVDNQSATGHTGEIVLNIDPENTLILDGVNGFPVKLEDVELGSFEAYVGPAMTMSLPPQTTPELVIVNYPEEVRAPQWITAEGAVEDGVLKAADGMEYELSEETEVVPYLTRNVVTLEDIAEDSRCLIWLDAEDKVVKLMLFAE